MVKEPSIETCHAGWGIFERLERLDPNFAELSARHICPGS